MNVVQILLFSISLLSTFVYIGNCVILRQSEVFIRQVHNAHVNYTTHYLSVPVDHFGYRNQDRFQLRYLVNNEYWDRNSGPIFMYTGNEGDIEWFCNNTGFMWDIAPEYKAMLVFIEHRYYGKSLPYGKDSFKDLEHLGYLTSEQALADFAETVLHVKRSTAGAAHSPVVAFGGSYGGMLAAWFRIKYPHVVIGALAASAPVLWFGDLTPCNAFWRVVTQDFARESKQCVTNIKRSWGVIDKMAQTESGRKQLSQKLRLCAAVNTSADAVAVKEWIAEVWGNLAMVDYPYAASFLEPLPGWPIKEVCKHLDTKDATDIDLISGIGKGLDVYFNYTGQARCLNTSQQASKGLGDVGWSFQACTEMVMPMCADGKSDMFEPSPWNLTQFARSCMKQWGVNPRPNWVLTEYGGRNISAASNIIFSNGKLDPWSGGGFLESVSDIIVAIVIAEGAHHLDLRSSNPADPLSVLKARHQEKLLISKWLRDFADQNSQAYTVQMLSDASRGGRSVLITGIVIVVSCFCLLGFVFFLLNQRQHKKYDPIPAKYTSECSNTCRA